MSLGRVFGWVVGAVLMFVVGYAIVTRVPGLMAALQPKQA
jgi:hypothetical protein